jgi:hypothetical protein
LLLLMVVLVVLVVLVVMVVMVVGFRACVVHSSPVSKDSSKEQSPHSQKPPPPLVPLPPCSRPYVSLPPCPPPPCSPQLHFLLASELVTGGAAISASCQLWQKEERKERKE